jgi:hypothetical protein
MNKLLDSYYKMLYFCKSKPTTLSQLSNWELDGILLHIKKYPVGLLNGYDKSEYINAVTYILKCRKQSKDHKAVLIESRLANKALINAEKLSKELLNMMINTEKQYIKQIL